MKHNENPNEESSRSQAKRILAYMQAGNRITHREAETLFGSSRLAARISDIKAEGHTIQSEMITLPNGKHVKAYWI